MKAEKTKMKKPTETAKFGGKIYKLRGIFSNEDWAKDEAKIL